MNFEEWKSLRENNNSMEDWRYVSQRAQELENSVNVEGGIELFWRAFRSAHSNLDPREAYILFEKTMSAISEEYFYPGMGDLPASGIDPQWIKNYSNYS